jgi:hypothetical protein
MSHVLGVIGMWDVDRASNDLTWGRAISHEMAGAKLESGTWKIDIALHKQLKALSYCMKVQEVHDL